MATLRVKDLVIGGVYREPLSGYHMRVRDFELNVMGDRIRAIVYYHNPVTGRFVQFTVRDGELEKVPTTKTKK